MRLVLFDFDGTLTERDSFIGFLNFYCGKSKFLFFGIYSFPIIGKWALKIIDASTAKKEILNLYIKGHQENSLKSSGVAYVNYLFQKKKFKQKILESLRNHISNSDRCIIVSASFEIWIKPFSEIMGVEYLCTNLSYKDGLYTGEFETNNCKGQEKVDRILKMLNINDYNEIIAYGNSDGDKEMMSLANIKNWID